MFTRKDTRKVRMSAQGRSPVTHAGGASVPYPYVQDPFPFKRGGILGRGDLGPPVVPGGQEDQLGILKPPSVAS